MNSTFLISHLDKNMRDTDELCYEIQLVDEFGQSMDDTVFEKGTSNVLLEGVAVPRVVLQAAMELGSGESEYVDVNGQKTYPGKSNSGQAIQNAYYIEHMFPDDHRPNQKVGQVFLVQLVNHHGQGIASAYLNQHEDSLQISELQVPSMVIDVVKSLPAGVGKYVNDLGVEVIPGVW